MQPGSDHPGSGGGCHVRRILANAGQPLPLLYTIMNAASRVSNLLCTALYLSSLALSLLNFPETLPMLLMSTILPRIYPPLRSLLVLPWSGSGLVRL